MKDSGFLLQSLLLYCKRSDLLIAGFPECIPFLFHHFAFTYIPRIFRPLELFQPKRILRHTEVPGDVITAKLLLQLFNAVFLFMAVSIFNASFRMIGSALCVSLAFFNKRFRIVSLRMISIDAYGTVKILFCFDYFSQAKPCLADIIQDGAITG